VHLLHRSGPRAFPGALPRRHVRRALPGALRAEQSLSRLHGLGSTVVLRAALPRPTPHRTRDRLAPPRLLPARRRPGLRDLLDPSTARRRPRLTDDQLRQPGVPSRCRSDRGSRSTPAARCRTPASPGRSTAVTERLGVPGTAGAARRLPGQPRRGPRAGGDRQRPRRRTSCPVRRRPARRGSRCGRRARAPAPAHPAHMPCMYSAEAVDIRTGHRGSRGGPRRPGLVAAEGPASTRRGRAARRAPWGRTRATAAGRRTPGGPPARGPRQGTRRRSGRGRWLR
jgi:hypothetical protein